MQIPLGGVSICIMHTPSPDHMTLDRPSFGAWPAPQLPADHLRRHVDTLCRSSTPAALPRVFVDSTLPAAASMMPVHARLAAGQLCNCAMASRQATPMAEHCGAVHPWGQPGGMDARPFAHPEHMMAELHDGFEPRARLWLVMIPAAVGHHNGTRAEVGHPLGSMLN